LILISWPVRSRSSRHASIDGYDMLQRYISVFPEISFV